MQMTTTTAGLPNGGVSAANHYKFQYDDSLASQGGPEPARTINVIAASEGDFNLMSGWFGNVALDVNFPITVNIIPPGLTGACTLPGACWGLSSRNLTVTISDSNTNTIDANIVRYLIVSEMVEQFERAQNVGWFGQGTEGSEGEGLSRFLGAQFLAVNGVGTPPGNPPSGYLNSTTWLTSARADFVNNIKGKDDGPDEVTGCTLLFIYYLFSQLGFSNNAIVAAGADSLGSVYKNLTADPTDPFPTFKQVVDIAFPGTSTITSGNLDNPFPLPTPRSLSLVRYLAVHPLQGGESIKDRIRSKNIGNLRAVLNSDRPASLLVPSG
jgi:hypothetical protein